MGVVQSGDNQLCDINSGDIQSCDTQSCVIQSSNIQSDNSKISYITDMLNNIIVKINKLEDKLDNALDYIDNSISNSINLKCNHKDKMLKKCTNCQKYSCFVDECFGKMLQGCSYCCQECLCNVCGSKAVEYQCASCNKKMCFDCHDFRCYFCMSRNIFDIIRVSNT